MKDLNVYAVEELSAEVATETNGGIWPALVVAVVGAVAKSAIDHADQIVAGFQEGYQPSTR